MLFIRNLFSYRLRRHHYPVFYFFFTILVRNMASSSQRKRPLSLDTLVDGEVDASDILKLEQAGFGTVEAIARAPLKKIKAVHGLNELVAVEVKESSIKLCRTGIRKATEYEASQQLRSKLTTGCKEFDQILQGGLEVGRITEVFGSSDTGKTQLCHTLAISCQLPVSSGGLDGRCLYLDTAVTFRPERLRAIAARFDLSPDEALGKVDFARAHSTDHLLELLDDAVDLMMKEKFSLLIVDPATTLYRAEFTGRGVLAVRQQHMGQLLCKLQKLADDFKIVVVITNHVVANVDNLLSGGPKDKPGGGNVIAHASQTRLKLRKGARGRRICEVFNSALVPHSECLFTIGKGGFMDGDN